MAYRIEYSPAAETHLRDLTARQRSLVLAETARQLTHEPTAETRNRKPMRPNPLARWALRVGVLRVYYEVIEGPVPLVLVKAVGEKQGNKVFIRGQEVAF